jgi:hypothetical protein
MSGRLRAARASARDLAESVAEHDAQERVVNPQCAVVVDEPELPKFVHEEVDARAGRSDHFGEDLLRHPRKGAVRHVGFTVPRQQQERTRKPSLAGVGRAGHLDLLRFGCSPSGCAQETIRERGLGVELPHPVLLLDDQDRARSHGRRS